MMATDTIEKDVSLTTAIEKAVEVHDKEIAGQDKSSVEVDSPGEEKAEEKEPEKEQPQVDLDAENGKILVQALRDPEKAAAVIDFLATKAGYTKGTVTTKAEAKEAKEEINDILERNLGEEFKFLAPKLAPAIKETVEKLLEGRSDNADLRARVEKQELKEIQNETAETHVALAQEWFGADEMPQKVVDAMSSAMDEFPPTDPNMAPSRYYKKIFSLVVGEMGLQKKTQRGDRVARNREDSVARNLSAQNRGVTPETVEGAGPRKMTLKDAVSLAVEQVAQSSKK